MTPAKNPRGAHAAHAAPPGPRGFPCRCDRVNSSGGRHGDRAPRRPVLRSVTSWPTVRTLMRRSSDEAPVRPHRPTAPARSRAV